MLPKSSMRAVRFGAFEVDIRSGELRKDGVRLRLQEQPLQVLAALLEHPGEVVTREELIRRLWADGTVVDFDRGLNAAVTRLRQALSDSADLPRYVETVARRGYRFISPVEEASQQPAPAPISATPPRLRAWPQLARSKIVFGIAGVVALATVLWWFLSHRGNRSEALLKVVPLTNGAGLERNPSFSPDGSQIVYEWERQGGGRHLYVKVVGTGDPIPLTSGPAAEYGPAWSPDGTQIAFLRELDESTVGVFVMAPVGGIERKVAQTPAPPYWVLERMYRRLDWTRDSRHLIVSVPDRAGAGEGLLLVSVVNGESMWLTKPSADAQRADREPAVSPDGHTVAFARGQFDDSEVIQLMALSNELRPAGPPRPLTSAGHARSPVWTGDGRQIVYTTLMPGMTIAPSMWIVGLNPGDVPRPLLALGRNAATPAISGGGRLAYSRVVLESSLWRQDVTKPANGSSRAVRLTSALAADNDPQYSPDGSRIAFDSNRSGSIEIWTCGSDGARCSQLTAFNGSSATDTPRWSPDGNKLTFQSAAAGPVDVYVINANGGPVRRLTDNRAHGGVPSWSRDGKWIYFSSAATGRSEVWKVPSTGGGPTQVTHNGGFVAFESPDGRFLYYTKVERDATLFRSGIDGSGETHVLSGVARRGFVVTADLVYYLHEDRDGSISIRQFSLATGEDSRLASAVEPVFVGLSLSPDRKYLVYSQFRARSNLMVVDDFH